MNLQVSYLLSSSIVCISGSIAVLMGTVSQNDLSIIPCRCAGSFIPWRGEKRTSKGKAALRLDKRALTGQDQLLLTLFILRTGLTVV